MWQAGSPFSDAVRGGRRLRLLDLTTRSVRLKIDYKRIIAASNRNLGKAVQESSFREDLYYRLNVFPIKIPPLRERKDDIPVLVRHFVRKYNAKIGKKIEKIPQNVIDTLQAYHWPGNVR